MKYLKYIFIGIFFGIVLTKSEAVSWFRIQEMFRFDSFHMYGLMGSAVATGALSVFLIRKFKLKTISGEDVVIRPKIFHKGFIIGGVIFGFGWAMTGACPGPLFALIGNGYTVFVVATASAILGTFTYGILKSKLPH